MLLHEKVRLQGSKRERVIKALELAGWYPGRSVDITKVERYYEKCGVELNEGARRFFREYHGLAESWWIDNDYKPNTASDFSFEPVPNGDYLQPKDFMFDGADYKVPSEEFVAIEQLAGEPVVYVGDIGYYYPARVWVSESGKIYATHEYDSAVHSFAAIADLVEWELSKQELAYITITNEQLTKEELATEFIKLFPHYQADYDEHIADYSELLGHVFFGDVLNRPLAALLKSNHDKKAIQQYMKFLEHMFAHGNEDVKNIVCVTILEYLGDDDIVLKNAYSYFSDELIEASVQVEKSLGRREIVISHENGKRLVGW